MFDIIFPIQNKQRYWQIHFDYVLQIFKYLDCRITYAFRDNFIVTIDNKDFLFDYSDSSEPIKSILPIFKFHCQKQTDSIFAFSPVSFKNWNEYYELEKKIQYKAQGNLIGARQIPHAGAKERRTLVQELLSQKKQVLTSMTRQLDYWLEINNLKLAVFVPGFCNNMIDRGQLQYMGLGCCTISPNLPEVLPFYRTFEPNVHYIRCKDDYADLIDIINSLDSKTCIEIGNNAKELFKQTCTPEKLGEWIDLHV